MDCQSLQDDLEAVYSWADRINMTFNSDKFEWVRYCVGSNAPPAYHYVGPDKAVISEKADLRDLGVRMSNDLSFNLQRDKVVASAAQMVSWGFRTFTSRGKHVMLVLLRSLVQPHLDYCSQLWSPTSQGQINKIEDVQKSLVSKIQDRGLDGLPTPQ